MDTSMSLVSRFPFYRAFSHWYAFLRTLPSGVM
jgi:hypothetical protein